MCKQFPVLIIGSQKLLELSKKMMLFVDFSSSPKKWAPEHNITNTDMGSEGLQAPQAFPALSSPQRISTSSQGSRKKVEYFKMFYYLFINHLPLFTPQLISVTFANENRYNYL